MVNYCTYTWTNQNGVNGGKFTGPNGGTIFLPVAGYRWDGELYDVGSWGYYWSSTPDGESSACSLNFGNGYTLWSYNWPRDLEQSVRPVR
ncbi:MAG: hypothetical protein IJ243_00715 [Prevotella sp.]|nr:hypothetical protein [Prevotella sp.]